MKNVRAIKKRDERAPVSVSDAVKYFLASPNVKRLARTTQVGYTTELEVFAKWCDTHGLVQNRSTKEWCAVSGKGQISLDQINDRVVMLYLEDFKETHQPSRADREEISTYTLSRIVRVIKTFLNWCVLDEQHGQHVALINVQRIKKPKVEEVIIETFSLAIGAVGAGAIGLVGKHVIDQQKVNGHNINIPVIEQLCNANWGALLSTIDEEGNVVVEQREVVSPAPSQAPVPAPEPTAETEDADEYMHFGETLCPEADKILSGRKVLFGVSEAGKSNAIAVLVEEIGGRYGAPLFLLDTEDEYRALCDKKYLARPLWVDKSKIKPEQAFEFAQWAIHNMRQVVINLQSYEDHEAAWLMINLIKGAQAYEESHDVRVPCEIILDKAIEWTHRADKIINLVLGYLLAIASVLGFMDVLSNGEVLGHVPFLFYVWLLIMGLGVDFQILLVIGRVPDLAHMVGHPVGKWILVSFNIVFLSFLAYVSIIIGAVFTQHRDVPGTIAQAMSVLNINSTSFVYERAALATFLLILMAVDRTMERWRMQIAAGNKQQGKQVQVTEEEQLVNAQPTQGIQTSDLTQIIQAMQEMNTQNLVAMQSMNQETLNRFSTVTVELVRETIERTAATVALGSPEQLALPPGNTQDQETEQEAVDAPEKPERGKQTIDYASLIEQMYQEDPHVTTTIIEQRLGCTRKTASKHLQRLRPVPNAIVVTELEAEDGIQEEG